MGSARLLGEVAVVTGAAHGIGRAIAVELGREGASVWACDVLERELGETRRAVGERAEGPCRVAVVDVTDARRVSEFVDGLVAAEGRLDVLVNCAGGVVGQTMRPVEEVSDEAWRAIFAVNLDGAFHFTRAVVPPMKARRRGQHREHLVGRGPLLQPHRDPGLRQRQGRADRAHPPDGARARRVRDPRQLRGAGLRPLEPGVRAAVAGHGRDRPAPAPRLDRPPAARRAGGHRPRGALLRLATTPGTSPARRSASTAATGCSGDRDSARSRLR